MKRFLSALALGALTTGLLAVPAQAADFDSTPHLVRDATPGSSSSSVYNAVALGSRILYAYDSPGYGAELWTSDGTRQGTHLVRDIMPGTGSSNPAFLTAFGGKVYFQALDATHGQELWVSDGTASGTKLFKDINPGAGWSDAGQYGGVAVGNTLYFVAAANTTVGRQVWKTDGNPAHTSPLMTIKPTGSGGSPYNLTRWGNRLVWTANDNNGNEPWTTDGTTTIMLKDINSGAGDSNPADFTVLGSELVFTAEATPGTRTLWKSTWSVGPNTALPLAPAATFTTPGTLVANGSVAYFTATQGTQGAELYQTDGTDAGTHLTMDINPTLNKGSTIGAMKSFRGSVYFQAEAVEGNSELWKANSSGVTLVKELNAGGPSHPRFFTAAGSQLFFTADNDYLGPELYATDGTTAGTRLVRDVLPGADGSYAAPQAGIGNTIFFDATTPALGDELYAYTTKASTTTGYPRASYTRRAGARKKIYVTVKVRALGAVPTGRVILKQGTTVVGAGYLTSGVAHIRIIKAWGKGTHRVRAYYAGSVIAQISHSTLIAVKVA